MRKPVLLVVDDDPAILEALEVALLPRFEAICRIEGFRSGGAVLAAVPRWREEKRPIAVAIVDQKMPGMTGVELLARLRQDAAADPTHPAAHVRAILLTGYAGLEGAIAAKNEAGVDRYLDKPWNEAVLAATASGLIADHLASSGTGRWYRFGEASNPDDVRAHLVLRYEVYRVGFLGAFLPGDGSNLDVDPFDKRAHLLSLTRQGPGGGDVIGTLRVVRENECPALPALRVLVAAYRPLAERLQAEPLVRFPLLEYWPDREPIERLLRVCDETRESVGEPGRLALHPSVRSEPVGTGSLGKFLIEGATAFFFFFFFFRNCVLSCVPAHERFYRPLGFKKLEGTRVETIPLLGVDAVCLHGTTDRVPEGVRGRLLAMADRIRRTGSVCMCPTYPACAPDAYASGRFSGLDLLCPAVAQEFLGTSVMRAKAPN